MSTFISIARTRTTLKACVLFVLTAALAASFTGMLRGSMPDVQTGTWTVTGNLDAVRAGAAAALLPDGRVLVTGGSDGTASIDTVQVYGSDGGFSGAASMSASRADHTATVLKDGSVLVVGGRNTEGAVSSAEIFINGTWFAGGALTDARWGHTATLLADGRVLITGGENGAAPLASFEIFDPATGQVSPAGSLTTARRGHAAAGLADGRVIIAGGESLDGALDSTEFIDTASSSVSAGPALGSRRVGLSATTLLDGKVLFLGGNNGTSNLASAELFNAATGAIAATASAAVARRDHQAFLLPNNNAVLIVGGIASTTVAGVTTVDPTASAELFLPWLQQVWPTASMSSARVKATGAALSKETYGAPPAGDGLLMVASGNGSNTSEAYRFATIRTDKDDYLPGDKVYVSGSGWQPNEVMTFTLKESPGPCNLRTFTLAADESGRLTNAFLFDVEDHHLGVRFYLTARGAASQAHATFTDGNLQSLLLSAPTSVTVAPGVTANYTANVAINGNSNQCTITLDITTALPAGAIATFASPNPTTTNADFSRALSIATSAGTPSGNYPFTVRAIRGANCQGNGNLTTNGTLVVTAGTATTTQPATTSATFSTSAQTVPLPATLTPAAINAGTVTFTVKDALNNPIGSPVTSGTVSGSAASANYTLPANTGAAGYTVTATYSGGGGFAGSSGTSTLTVGKADQSITFGALAPKTYGNPQFGVISTSTSGLTVSFAASGSCTVSGSTVTITGAGNCTITASQPGNGNYNAAADVPQSFTIGKAALTVTADNASRAYGDANPSFTASYAGFVNSETFATSGVTGAPSLTTTAIATSGVAGSPYVITAAAGSLASNNYAFTFVDGQLTINKAGLTVTADDTSRFYGDANPSFTASYAGFKNAETLATSGITGAPSLTSTANAASSVAGSPYAITVAAGTLASTNYSFMFVDGKLTVNKAPLSATAAAAARDYGDANPAFTGTLTGVKNGEAITATYASAATATTAAATYGPATANAVVATVTGAPPTLLDNYVVTTTNGTLTINKAALSATAAAAARDYGDANPTFTGTLTGVKNSEAITATYASAATATTAAATYGPATANAIIPTVTGAPPTLLDNYIVTTTNGTLTINKAALSATAAAAARDYGDANPTFTGTLTGVKNGEAITATYASAATTTTAAATYGPATANAVIPTVTGAPPTLLENYIVTTTNGTLTINKAALSATAAGASRPYGDANPTFTGTLTGVKNGEAITATYASAATATTAAATYGPETANAIIPTVTGAPPTLLDNYVLTTTNGTLTINKAALSATAAGASRPYGDANPTFTGTLTGVKNGEAITATYASAATATTAAATYGPETANAIIPTVTGAPPTLLDNYVLTTVNGTLTINKASLSAAAADASRPYGDANPMFTGTLTGVKNGEAITATYASAATVTTAVGTYGPDDPNAITPTVTATPLTLLDNYVVTTTDGTLTITARAVTVTADAKSKTYGDDDPALTYQVTTGSLVNGDTVSGTLTRVGGENVGSYAIEQGTLSLSTNYALTYAGASFTILKRLATWTTDANSKTYGDADPTPLTTGTGNNFMPADGVTVAYTRVAGESVGSSPYAITATLSAANAGALDNYTITNAGASFTIIKRSATWTTDANSKTYGDADPTPLTTGTGSNFMPADGVTAAYTRVAGESVGSSPYAITATLSAASGGALDNYTITNTGASFTILKRLASWTTDANSKTYGDADPTPLTTGTGSNFMPTDGVTAAYTRVAGESVGSSPYAISATLSAAGAGALDNYTITNAGANFTIIKRPATWTTDANSKTYGDADPTPLTTGTGSNFMPADGVTAAYSRVAGELVGSSPYAISATLSAAGAGALDNYTITNAGASFTIIKRSATWTTQPNTKVYGNADPSPLTTGAGSNFVAGDNVTATYARAAGETVAGTPYQITATLSAASAATLANYNITNTGADFTITKRAATVVVDDKTKLLNAPNPALTGTLTNLVAADNITATYSTTATTGSPVGNYPIIATLVDPNGKLANYTVTNTPGTLKVLFRWDGFLQPINNTAHDGHQTLPYSKFKPGQTIPAKFQLKDANGNVVQQTGPAWFNYARIAGACGGVEPDVDIDLAYEDTVPVYSFNGGHYQFNWSTKNLPMGLYRIFANLQNNQQVYTDICLTK